MSYTLNFGVNRYQHFLLHNWEGCPISACRQVNMTEVLCGFPYSLHAGSGILTSQPHNLLGEIRPAQCSKYTE